MTINTKFTALSAAILCAFALSGTASAGALNDPIVEKPISAINEKNWQGLRGGLAYNTEVDSLTRVFSEGFQFIDNKNDGLEDLGGFLGFDFQHGHLVFGIEAQATPQNNPVQGNPTRIHGDLQSLRGRIGYAAGKTLFYGSFGSAQGSFDDAGSNVDLNGQVYGLGIEHLITDHIFIGLSADHYVMSGENIMTASNVESEQTILQLRIGFTF